MGERNFHDLFQVAFQLAHDGGCHGTSGHHFQDHRGSLNSCALAVHPVRAWLALHAVPGRIAGSGTRPCASADHRHLYRLQRQAHQRASSRSGSIILPRNSDGGCVLLLVLRSRRFLSSLSLPSIISRRARPRWGAGRQSAHPGWRVSNRIAGRAARDHVGSEK